VHFALALGKDPSRIFEFVRDQVAYEAYAGSLRGPRGTLLAMAGNSVDRAALLASLLKCSGQRVRFVRGKLPTGKAEELVASMWVERAEGAPSEPARELSPAVKAANELLVAGIRRDGALLRDSLKKAGLPVQGGEVSPQPLIAEAQDHYWIQWWRNGSWVDLDSSFATATPGQTYAQPAETRDALPEPLFHRVNVRLRLEESTGGKPTSREILKYSAKAADLSGVDLVLIHRAEEARSQGAASPLGPFSGGRTTAGQGAQTKPTLLVRSQQIAGQAFGQKAPSQGTGAGFGGLLGGDGEAAPAATVIGEFIEFDFIAPDGRKETVVREIFDLVGAARRRKGEMPDATELTTFSKTAATTDLTGTIHDLFITTGSIHAGHLANLAIPPVPAKEDPVDLRAGLQRINIAFSATSDALVGRVTNPEGAICRFYPDSPRVHIAELSTKANLPRLSLDLRRDQCRAVGTGIRSEQIFNAQLVRGVVEGTLERAMIEFFAGSGEPRELPMAPAMSTSLLFERAQTLRKPAVVFAPGGSGPGNEVPADSRARIEAALAAGCAVLAPAVPIEVAGAPRFAWWQVDSRSGMTTAVTDEGLHQAIVEVSVIKNKDGTTTVLTGVKGEKILLSQNFTNGGEAMDFVIQLQHWAKTAKGVSGFAWL